MHTSLSFLPTADIARIRNRLDHPIVDGDGHLLEFLPLVYDLIRAGVGTSRVFEVRGPMMVQDRYDNASMSIKLYHKDIAVIEDHAAPVAYEIPLPPQGRDQYRGSGASFYVHAPRGRKGRAIDGATERFVEDTRTGTSP